MVQVAKIDINTDIKIETWLLGIYLFFVPLDFFPILPGVSIQRLISFMPLAGLLFYIKSMRVRVDRYFILPVIYVSFLVLTSIYSYSINDTEQRILSTGTNIALILLVSMIDYSKREVNLLRKATVLSGWLAFFLLVFSIRDIDAGRITIVIGGTSPDYNYLVGYFIFTLMYYMEQFVKNRKIWHMTFVMAILGVIFLTGSRGGLAASLGAAFFYITVCMKDQKLKISSIIRFVLITFLILLIVYFVFNFLPDVLRERFLPTEETLLRGGATRFEIWESLIDSYVSAPLINQLFGMGAGTVRSFTFNHNVGHNIWLDSIIETGIIGTVLLFVFYFSFINKAYRLKDYVVAASFVGYMLMAMTMSLYRYRPIWNIILIVTLLKNYSIAEAEKQELSFE